MRTPEDCSQLPIERRFHSNTGATVGVVRDEQGVPWVRKTEDGTRLVSVEQETSQPVAVFLDHVRFNNGALLSPVTRCKDSCIGTCNVSPYMEGQSLTDILGEDNAGIELVAKLRLALIHSMSEGGYFDQKTTGCPSAFYRSRFIETPHVLSWLENSQNLYIQNQEIDTITRESVDYLCHSDFEVPMGMFPNDLNITNILARSKDQELRVIDQGMSWASPGVPIAKMIIGWRGLAILAPKRPDWSELNLDSLYENIDLTKRLDREYLENFFSQYSWISPDLMINLIREISAVQILKTFIALNKYVDRNQMPPQEVIDSVIGPFFSESVESFNKLNE